MEGEGQEDSKINNWVFVCVLISKLFREVVCELVPVHDLSVTVPW